MDLSSLDNCWRTIAALRAALAETTGVFLCGCPPEDHESYGEDGESCGHDDHECIRTCRAIQTLYTRRSAALKKAEEERDAQTRRADVTLAKMCDARDAVVARATAAEAKLKKAEEENQNFRGDACENGHHKHEDCTEACSCIGAGKSRIEKAE